MTISLKAVSKIALISSGFALLGSGCVGENDTYGPDGLDSFDGDGVAQDDAEVTPPPIVVDPDYPTADTPLPAVFADKQINASNLTIIGNDIYWIESADNTVVLKWMHVDGGENFRAAELESLPFSSVADDAGLYFAASSEQNIVFAPHIGLEAEPLHSSATDPLALALTEEHAYWTAADGCLFQGPKEGGAAVILGCAPNPATTLAIAGDSAYLATVAGGLYRSDLQEGGAFEKIASEQDFGFGLVADEVAVYWGDATSRSVRSYSHASGEISVIAASQFAPTSVAQDRFYLYFSTQGDGSVKRILKTGGAVEVMAEQQDEPSQLVATDEFIFWVNEGNGTVMRQLKDFDY